MQDRKRDRRPRPMPLDWYLLPLIGVAGYAAALIAFILTR